MRVKVHEKIDADNAVDMETQVDVNVCVKRRDLKVVNVENNNGRRRGGGHGRDSGCESGGGGGGAGT